MAHSWRAGRHPLTALCAATLALCATDAAAIALGDVEVRSALGEALDVRIPVIIGPGESIEPSCFKLARGPAADAPGISGGRISIERSAQGNYLRIRSAFSVSEPTLSLAIVAACPGQVGEYKRDYSLSLGPRSAAAEAAAAAPLPVLRSTASPVGSIVATLIGRIGDTLESIANAIFPRNRAAKKSYIEALRETNPPLASLGESEPIPVETPIALPDLRTFAKSLPARGAQVASAPTRASGAQRPPASAAESKAPAAVRERPAPRERPASPRPAIERKATAESTAPARTTPPATRRPPSPGFVLKLSSGEVDLSRSRAIDDRGRARLRDRQLLLDADDQVAAVLALRNSVRQLESQVAELQLKLAGMPSSFPAPKGEAVKSAPPSVRKAEAPAPLPAAPPAAVAPVPSPAPAPAPAPAAPTVAVAPVPTPVPAPAKATPAATPPPPPLPAAPVSPPPVAAAPESSATPPSAVTEPASAPATPESTPAPEPAPTPATKPSAADNDWVRYGLWGVAAVLIALAALLAWGLARRKKAAFEEAPVEEQPPEDEQIVVADEHVSEEPAFVAEPFEVQELPPEARRELDSDVDLTTRIPEGNTDDLRRRYIEQRFPEIVNRTIVLDEPGSVVKGARLFYEDGAVARAVELLHFAIERNPLEVKTWLALFEIFRLERLAGEFAELARRFNEHHGNGPYWRKVQYFGREIDPGNALYHEEPINKFETIGPSQARRLAAEASFDPVAENWLNAPMDFENEVLANDLRKALMAEKGINEEDLVPNPMPALRNVEMFTIA